MEQKNTYILICINAQFSKIGKPLAGMLLLIFGPWQLHFIMQQLDSYLSGHSTVLGKIHKQWEG